MLLISSKISKLCSFIWKDSFALVLEEILTVEIKVTFLFNKSLIALLIILYFYEKKIISGETFQDKGNKLRDHNKQKISILCNCQLSIYMYG